jgi:hypothetical protein
MYGQSNSGNWSSRSQQSTDTTFDRDATPPLQKDNTQEEHEGRPILLEQDVQASNPPKDTLRGSAMGTPDLATLLAFMQDQEARRRREEEARRVAEKEQEAVRHREWMHLEMKKLELEEKRLQQNATAEEARRAAEARREEERKKERDLDRRLREIAQLPRMSENEDVELYLESFEFRLQSLEIPDDRWVSNLRPLLSTWAAQVVDALSQTDRSSYSKVKHFLLEAYCSTKGPLGTRALAPKREQGQTIAQFCAQQRRLWTQWMDGFTRSELAEKITLVQAELALPYTCRMHVRSAKPKSIPELVTEVEDFFATRKTTWDDAAATSRSPGKGQRWSQHPAKESAGQGQPDQSIDKKSTTTMTNRSKERSTTSLVVCFNCGQKGHFAAQCPDKHVRINKISTSNSIMVSGKISNKETSMMLDSGAAMSLFPAKFVDRKDYTGGWMTVRGAVGEQSLQTAVVTVEMEGEKEDMRVLVTMEDTTPLLGMDYIM